MPCKLRLQYMFDFKSDQYMASMYTAVCQGLTKESASSANPLLMTTPAWLNVDCMRKCQGRAIHTCSTSWPVHMGSMNHLLH